MKHVLYSILLASALAVTVVTAASEQEVTADTRSTARESAREPAAKEPDPGADITDLEYAGQERCMECHEEEANGFRGTAHARTWNPRTPASADSCETCHGPGKAHADDPDNNINMKNFAMVTPREASETCMGCHNRADQALWEGSMHDSRNITCVSCHSVHAPQSEKAQLKEATITETCSSCHRDKAAKMLRSAHMPVREGKLECTTCHNQHGSTNERLLREGNTVNEFCGSCHAEKRGPFLWEHAPVRENCTTCHEPHGSSNDRMLVAKAPMLCQRCHAHTRHPSTIYDGAAVLAANNRIAGRSCVNCHPNIHGSNHPSGMFFQR